MANLSWPKEINPITFYYLFKTFFRALISNNTQSSKIHQTSVNLYLIIKNIHPP